MTRKITRKITRKTTFQTLAPLSLFAALALAAAPAQAQLTFALAPVAPLFTSSADQTVTFSATLTNGYTYPLYLNGDFFSPPAAPLGTDDSLFQNTFVTPASPPALAAGSVTTTDLFTVLVPANTVPNSYDGTFYITGGQDLLATQGLASAPFHLDVQAVPEASTTVSLGLLLIFGAGGMIAARRKRASGRD